MFVKKKMILIMYFKISYKKFPDNIQIMVPEPTSSNDLEYIFQDFTNEFIAAGMPSKCGIEQMAWLAEKSKTYKGKEIGLSADFCMKVILFNFTKISNKYLRCLFTSFNHNIQISRN